MNSELWSILHGMEIAQENGYRKIIIETDCMMALEIIEESMGNMPSITIVRRIKTWIQLFEDVKFHFVHKEGNMVANWLARSCSSNEVNLVNIDIPGIHVRKLLLEDKIDISM